MNVKKKVEDYAPLIEGKVLHVMDVYNRLMPCSTRDVKEVFGMARNTLTNNLKLSHHPKLKVLLDIFFGWFSEMEGHVFPDLPKEIVIHLSPSELQARIFAACLNDEKDRMKEVSALLGKLRMGKFLLFQSWKSYWKRRNLTRKSTSRFFFDFFFRVCPDK